MTVIQSMVLDADETTIQAIQETLSRLSIVVSPAGSDVQSQRTKKHKSGEKVGSEKDELAVWFSVHRQDVIDILDRQKAAVSRALEILAVQDPCLFNYSAEYLLYNFDRLSADDFTPTEDDLLHVPYADDVSGEIQCFENFRLQLVPELGKPHHLEFSSSSVLFFVVSLIADELSLEATVSTWKKLITTLSEKPDLHPRPCIVLLFTGTDLFRRLKKDESTLDEIRRRFSISGRSLMVYTFTINTFDVQLVEFVHDCVTKIIKLPKGDPLSSVPAPLSFRLLESVLRAKMSQQQANKILGNNVRNFLTIRKLSKFISNSPELRSDRVRLSTVRQILDSEILYQRQLETIVNVLLMPFKVDQDKKMSKLLNEKQVKAVFANIENIKQVNEKLLNVIQEGDIVLDGVNLIANGFSKLAPFLKVYSLYMSNYDNAISTFNQAMTKNPKLEKFIDKFFLSPECQQYFRNRSIEDVLAAPLWHIPQALSLLMTLSKNVSPQHRSAQLLLECISQIEKVQSYLEDSKVKAQTDGKVLKFLEFKVCRRLPSLVRPGRYFIRHRFIIISCPEKNLPETMMNAYLFNDLLIITSDSHATFKEEAYHPSASGLAPLGDTFDDDLGVHIIFLAFSQLVRPGDSTLSEKRRGAENTAPPTATTQKVEQTAAPSGVVPLYLETFQRGGRITYVLTFNNNNEKQHWEQQLTQLCLNLEHFINNLNKASMETPAEEWDMCWFIDFKNEIVIEKKIGAGAFGIVYAGKWYKNKNNAEDQIDVAIKMLKSQSIEGDSSAFREFKREVNILRRLGHPNILRIFGASLQQPNVAMITELANTGNLKKLLLKTDFDLSWSERLNLLTQCARGMEYLHTRTPPVLHRDLKTENLLLFQGEDGKLLLKVADFGFAKVRLHTVTLTGQAGTPLYMSPEMLREDRNLVGLPSDVYSYAVIMWEVLTRQEVWKGVNWMVVTSKVVAKERPPIPIFSDYRSLLRQTGGSQRDQEGLFSNFVKLMVACWAQEPHQRPNFSEIVTRQMRECVSVLPPRGTTQQIVQQQQRQFQQPSSGGVDLKTRLKQYQESLSKDRQTVCLNDVRASVVVKADLASNPFLQRDQTKPVAPDNVATTAASDSRARSLSTAFVPGGHPNKQPDPPKEKQQQQQPQPSNAPPPPEKMDSHEVDEKKAAVRNSRRGSLFVAFVRKKKPKEDTPEVKDSESPPAPSAPVQSNSRSKRKTVAIVANAVPNGPSAAGSCDVPPPTATAKSNSKHTAESSSSKTKKTDTDSNNNRAPPVSGVNTTIRDLVAVSSNSAGTQAPVVAASTPQDSPQSSASGSQPQNNSISQDSTKKTFNSSISFWRKQEEKTPCVTSSATSGEPSKQQKK